ncbi:DUF167 domain-containing protein [Agromyces sp. MMS24-JH15]|uniref:DUF167 domain-containing protein n=1 Tax=Agromyces sp. MMS24-JH15 TaxID=3243765 RepID=UPI0037495BC9
MDLTIRVKPGSRKGPLVEALESDPVADWVVHVQERAVDGAANDGVVAALAVHFGVPRSRVAIVRGATARVKRVRIDEG